MNIIIRQENEKDFRAVEELTRDAFWNIHVPGCDEHLVLHKMRGHKDFIKELDYVAELDGKIVGHIAYTFGKIVDKYGCDSKIISFGPISVLPKYQKSGVGSELIYFSLNRAKKLGYNKVCIYGDPRYYGRFGFRCAEKYEITNSDGMYAIPLLALELVKGAFDNISGRFYETEAFEATEDELIEFEKSFPPKEKKKTPSQDEFKVLASLRY